MEIVKFQQVKVAGIAGAAPQQVIDNHTYDEWLGKKVVDRVIKTSGVRQIHRAIRRQTASDLGYAAAEQLLTQKQIDRSQIGAIINVTETPDYVAPASAFVLHHRLGLPVDCMPFDVNLGCPGYVYGLHIAAGMLSHSPKKYVLLIVGDVFKNNDFSGRENPDHTYLMMLGDGATATLLERSEAGTMETVLFAETERYKVLHTMGGARCVDAPHDVTRWQDGVDRSLYDCYMDGMEVFQFSTKRAPEAIRGFLAEKGQTSADYDYLYLHQANKMIVDRVGRLAGFHKEQVPQSLDRYGNSSCASIPITIVDHLGDMAENAEKRLLLCGFGVGLAWGVVSLTVQTGDILPMIFSDDFYQEGEIYPA